MPIRPHRRNARKDVDQLRPFLKSPPANYGSTILSAVDHGLLTGLGDDDHTLYLRVNGSRALTGDLNMGSQNIVSVNLVDGVDVSAHASRHASGGADSVSHDTLADFVGNEHIDHTAVSITSGSGITGGGTIESTRTLNLDWGTPTIGTIEPDDGASAGSSTNPTRSDHQHAISTAAPAANSVSLSASGKGSGSDFAGALHTHNLDVSIAPSWTGTHSFNQDIQLNANLDFIGAQSITTNAGNLTIQPTADLILDPSGADVRMATDVTIKSDDYGSQTTGWGISYAGGADFRYLFADELHVKSFITDLEQALAGGQIICKSVAVLSRTFTAPAASGTTTLYVWDLPSAEDMAVFETGDIVRLRTFSRAGGGLTVTDCWGVVTAYSNLIDKEQSWTFTRSAGADAGAMAEDAEVDPDALVLDYGTDGNGYYEVNAIDGVYAENSPYAQIVTWATHPATGKTVRTRMGQLTGITTTDEHGLYAGEGVGVGDAYIRITDQNVDLHNIDMAFYDSGNVQRIGFDPGVVAAEKLLWAGESSGSPKFVVYGDGDVWLSNLAISSEFGQQHFTVNDGLLLLGPGCEWTTTSWTSLRGQTATISGAFHTVAGRWAGTQALMVEEETTNLIVNPVFELGLYRWVAVNTPDTFERSTTYSYIGAASGHVAHVGGALRGAYIYQVDDVSASQTYTLTLRIRGAGGDVEIRLDERDVSNVRVGYTEQIVTLTGSWQTVTITRAFGATGVKWRAYAMTNTADATDFYFDALQLEEHAWPTSLIYGDLAWGDWSGTAHQSTSTRVSTKINLDAHAADLLDLNDTWSISFWWQPQYDADADWPDPSYLFYVMRDDVAFRVIIEFDDDDDKYNIYINAGWRFQSSAQTFKAGGWQHIIVTFDFAAESYKLYVNGVADGSDDTELAARSLLTEMALGSSVTGGAVANAAWSECALFDSVIAAAEAAAIYQSGLPLVDQGATGTPGIYILDGSFKIASSISGQRIEITTEEIAGYDGGGTKQFYLQSGDGKAYTGDGAVMMDDTGITITTTGEEDNIIRWINTDITTYTNTEAFANLQKTDPGSQTYGTFNLGLWHDANNQSGIACYLHQVDTVIHKSGAWRYVLEVNYDWININSVPLKLGNGTSDPTVDINDGMLFYRTDTDKLRLRANGAWVDLN